MNSIFRVYATKTCLCANPYVPVFFVVLTRNGLNEAEVASAIALGTLTMLLGDGLTGLLSDCFGPRRVVSICGVLQGISICSLPWCHNVTTLYGVEILIGLTFPAIHGADSKWLRRLDVDCHSERLNQAMTWSSQLISGIIGGMLVLHPDLVCMMSAAIYASGAMICLTLPDISSDRTVPRDDQSKTEFRVFTWSRIGAIMLFGILLGCTNAVPWLLQFHASTSWSGHPMIFAGIQVAGSALSIAGSFFHGRLLPGRIACVGTIVIVMVYPVLAVRDSTVLIWIPIGVGMLLRGSLSVAARESVLSGIPADAPVASLVATVNAQSKLAQAVCLTFICDLVLGA